MAKQVIDPVAALEKQLQRLQMRLQKARESKRAKLSKAVDSKTQKITKLKQKLLQAKAQKTPAAKRQVLALKDKIIEAKQARTLLKAQLAEASAAIKHEAMLKKAQAEALRLAEAPRKKTKPKSTAGKHAQVDVTEKKSKQRAAANLKLTPDLSQPVKTDTKSTPNKPWQPKTKAPVAVKAEVTEKVKKTAAKKVTETAANNAVSTPVLKSPDKPLTQSTAAPAAQSAQTKPIAEPTVEAPKPRQPDTPAPVTNWHAIPLVKQEKK
ncbi:MAG: hypothetical protein KTR20_15225 [Cellvibrionaceae bacterium]|nr:hypothetical protein [Cellvibrionaceae bacterium]